MQNSRKIAYKHIHDTQRHTRFILHIVVLFAISNISNGQNQIFYIR